MRDAQPNTLPPWEVVLGFRVVSRHNTEDEARSAAAAINVSRGRRLKPALASGETAEKGSEGE